MTEVEWLTSNDPQPMLHYLRYETHEGPGEAGGSHLRERPLISDRKLRLFACACVRQVWPALADGLRAEVVFAEQEPRHQSALAAMRPEFLSQDAITNYTEAVGDRRCVIYAVHWLGAASAAEAASQAPAWLQRMMLFQTQADLLREIVGNPFRPVTLPVSRRACPNCFGEKNVRYTCQDCDEDGTVACPYPWLTPTVLSLANAAYEERQAARTCPGCLGSGHGAIISSEGAGSYGRSVFEKCKQCNGAGLVGNGTLDPLRLAVLSDALEDAGCDNEDLLRHLRGQEICRRCGGDSRWKTCDGLHPSRLSWDKWSPWVSLASPHYRGCWALDLILGKE